MGEKWESHWKAEIPLFEGKFIKITGKQELFIASEINSAAMRGIDRWSWIFVKVQVSIYDDDFCLSQSKAR